MGWDDRLDEQRASAPETPAHRSRKDRRRWCRGKVGVEHVTEVQADHGRRGQHTPLCWRSEWMPRDWNCGHQEVCTNCGKIVRRTLGVDCPAFTRDVTWFRAGRGEA